MSTSGTTFASDLQIEVWVRASVYVLAMYDYVITVDQEVSSVWKRKINATSVLLLAARWTMVLGAIILYIPSPQTLTGCKVATAVSEFLALSTLCIVAVFSGIRVYALWGGSIVLFSIVFLLEFTPVVANIYRLTKTTYPTTPFVCIEIPNIDPGTFVTLIRVARIPVIVGNGLVVVVTWIRSFRQILDGRRQNLPVPLSTIIFRDGTVYFLLLLLINLLELCTNLSNVFGSVCNVLPPILVNRFLLNLREVGGSEAGHAGGVRTISTPVFRFTIDMTANMGESLEYGDREGEENGGLGAE